MISSILVWWSCGPRRSSLLAGPPQPAQRQRRARGSGRRRRARLTDARPSSAANDCVGLLGRGAQRRPRRVRRRGSPASWPGSTWRQAAAEDPAQVVDGAALGADAGHQQRPVDVEVLAGLADRGADDGAERAERLGAGVEPRQAVEHARRRRCARRSVRACCTSGALRVGGQREHEQPGVVRARGVDQRVERAEAEVGAGGDRVGGQRARSGRGRRRRTPARSSRCRRASRRAAPARRPRGGSRPPAPAPRSRAMPNRSKNADCGLTHRDHAAPAPRPRSARTAPARRRRRSAPSRRSSAACGSMPAQSGPRSSIAARSRAPNGRSCCFIGRPVRRVRARSTGQRAVRSGAATAGPS